jgi:hypothetical protein
MQITARIAMQIAVRLGRTVTVKVVISAIRPAVPYLIASASV